MLQAALRLSDDKKRRIVENRRRLLLNLEALLRKQNMVRSLSGACLKLLDNQSPGEAAALSVTQPHHTAPRAWPGPAISIVKLQICSKTSLSVTSLNIRSLLAGGGAAAEQHAAALRRPDGLAGLP